MERRLYALIDSKTAERFRLLAHQEGITMKQNLCLDDTKLFLDPFNIYSLFISMCKIWIRNKTFATDQTFIMIFFPSGEAYWTGFSNYMT